MTYHINKKGVPAICRAKDNNCPLGSNNEHFKSKEEAQKHIEEKYSDVLVPLPKQKVYTSTSHIQVELINSEWDNSDEPDFEKLFELNENELKTFIQRLKSKEEKISDEYFSLYEKISEWNARFYLKHHYKDPEKFDLAMYRAKENREYDQTIDALEAYARQQGLPKIWAQHFFTPLRDKKQEFINSEITKEKLTPELENQEQKEFMKKVLDDFFVSRKGSDLIEKTNQNISFLKEEHKISLREKKEYDEYTQKANNLISEGLKNREFIKKVQEQIEWREKAKPYKFNMERPGKPIYVHEIKGSDLITDSSGNIKNLWVKIENGTDEVVRRITGWNSYDTYDALHDSKGNEYSDIRHVTNKGELRSIEGYKFFVDTTERGDGFLSGAKFYKE